MCWEVRAVGQLKTYFSGSSLIEVGWFGIYYTCSKTRLTENVFLLTPALTLKHNNVFGLKKWRYFSRKCTDTLQQLSLLGGFS